MKRYTIDAVYECESPDGEWVRYDDHLAEVTKQVDAAMDTYRRSIVEVFDCKKVTEPIRWHAGPGSHNRFLYLHKAIQKIRFMSFFETFGRIGAPEVIEYQMEGATRKMAMILANKLIKDGFIEVSNEIIPGIGHRLTWTIYAAKSMPNGDNK